MRGDIPKCFRKVCSSMGTELLHLAGLRDAEGLAKVFTLKEARNHAGVTGLEP